MRHKNAHGEKKVRKTKVWWGLMFNDKSQLIYPL